MNAAANGPRRDYYEVLGLTRDADDKAVREAFRRLARRYHPDVSAEPGAEERFKEIAEAYSVLSDPGKRASYDARGFAGVPAAGQEYAWGNIDFGDILGGLGFGEDLLSHLFARRPEAARARGEDIRIAVTVPMFLVLRGGERAVAIPARRTCPDCSGTGTRPGTWPRACPDCGGTGQHVSTTRHLGVLIRQTTACGSCEGKGTIIDHPCPRCHGSGEVPVESTVTVKIPKGIPDGTRLRLAGHGLPAPAPGGRPGDVFLVVTAEPVPGFTRSGADLWHELHVTVTDAALGATFRLAAPAGPVKVAVPGGTQPGTVLRLRGHGLPRYGARGRGDLNVRLLVDIPRRLSRQQRRLYEQLRAADAARRDGAGPDDAAHEAA
ncbi:MAG TPA: J domain-containing protein [Trebonia sp.]|nr:J domain-containing protein [Trebonia sp.]